MLFFYRMVILGSNTAIGETTESSWAPPAMAVHARVTELYKQHIAAGKLVDAWMEEEDRMSGTLALLSCQNRSFLSFDRVRKHTNSKEGSPYPHRRVRVTTPLESCMPALMTACRCDWYTGPTRHVHAPVQRLRGRRPVVVVRRVYAADAIEILCSCRHKHRHEPQLVSASVMRTCSISPLRSLSLFCCWNQNSTMQVADCPKPRSSIVMQCVSVPIGYARRPSSTARCWTNEYIYIYIRRYTPRPSWSLGPVWRLDSRSEAVPHAAWKEDGDGWRWVSMSVSTITLNGTCIHVTICHRLTNPHVRVPVSAIDIPYMSKWCAVSAVTAIILTPTCNTHWGSRTSSGSSYSPSRCDGS